MNSVSISDILLKLHIHYRKFPNQSGTIYFCTPPSQVTFNILETKDGLIKLWCFIDKTPLNKAVWKHRIRINSNVTIGTEVTDENDVSFYMKYYVPVRELENSECMYTLVKNYSEMVTTINHKLPKM